MTRSFCCSEMSIYSVWVRSHLFLDYDPILIDVCRLV